MRMKKYKLTTQCGGPNRHGRGFDLIESTTAHTLNVGGSVKNVTRSVLPSKVKKRNRKGVRINFRLFTISGNLPGLYKL